MYALFKWVLCDFWYLIPLCNLVQIKLNRHNDIKSKETASDCQ
jgi:hypothetical protein